MRDVDEQPSVSEPSCFRRTKDETIRVGLLLGLSACRACVVLTGTRVLRSLRAGFFVEAGFQVKGGLLGWPWTWKKSYAPPSGWNERFQDEWVFEYTLEKTGSTFFLHCSTRNGKMYVRAIRANNLEGQPDINVLGLEISKYVSPKEEIVAATSWAAVLHNTDKLAEQTMEHLIQPFLVTEKRELLASPNSSKWKDYLAIKASEWTDASVVLPVLSVGLVFAMGLGMSVYRRRISL